MTVGAAAHPALSPGQLLAPETHPPKALLEMAGAPLVPPPPDRSALVLIDFQMEYATGTLALPGVGATLDEMARHPELARAEGVPVALVVHHGRPDGGLFDPDGEFAVIAGQVAPAPGEPVITKTMPNAFASTRLDAQLKEFERGELIIAGSMIHMCVSSSARAFSELSYRATVVADDLHNLATPLIRYETGDYAKVGELCPCGRGLRVLSRILGRTRNMVTLPGGEKAWPLPYWLRELLATVPVRQIQFIQRSLDEIAVKLAVERDLTELEEDGLRKLFLRRLGHPSKLRFICVDDIPRSAGGKYEDFVSEI
ncbi:MAG: isochorismatase family protein [Rhodospirillales bacterium]|nr:isochorismatase family protein [Rhodospirillales bacterium]HJO73082.1 isochorismatase family protein [Rhodospirillales bacterium]